MKIAIAFDHAGFILKETIINCIKKLGHNPIDFGTDSTQAVDYPDFASKAAKAVADKETERAIIVCGSGVGACITANKFKGVRAAICHDTYSAAQGVEHDDMNTLCLGARIIGPTTAETIIKSFLNVSFTNEERHKNRLNKVLAFEESNMK